MAINTSQETYPATVGEILDRLEVPAGKIGLNTPAQSLNLLHGLDEAYHRIQELPDESQSRRLAETQFDDILAKMHAESGRFLRDLGGTQVLHREREKLQPPEDHEWWYLDVYLAEKRKAALRRNLIIGGIVVLVLVALVVVYNNFLAPDPQVAALYGFQQSGQDAMMRGDFEAALNEVNQGLQVNPNDSELLIMKGVILEEMGNPAEAEQNFAAAKKTLLNQEDFLIARAQAYLMSNQPEKALADAQAATQMNPQSANGYLMAGQANEILQQYSQAMDDYNKAYEAADKTGQPQLAAIARTRLAMLLQSMNSQLDLPSVVPTGEPTP